MNIKKMALLGKKISISGYRGIWEKDWNIQASYVLALAFAKFIKDSGGKKIAIGRDARKSGPQILSCALAAFHEEGLQVVDLGIIPTPSVLLIVKKEKFDAGLVITASHNPIEYNGYKFIMNTGFFASQESINVIEKNYIELKNREVNRITTQQSPDNREFRKMHILEIMKHIDAESIKNKKFKIVLDPVNSAGSIITQELLNELNCEVKLINGEPNGEFSRNPEPTIESCEEIGPAVKISGADVGFSQDPDADRLLVTTEEGQILSEEYSLALAVENVLKNKKTSDIVINMSTSSMTAELAKQHGSNVHRTRIGELNVVEKIIEVNGVGGEGSGGIIYPPINTARDSLVGIAFVLELMAKEDKKLSEIANSLPKYFMRKDKINFSGNLAELYKKIKNNFPDSVENTLDGLRLDFDDDSWLHVRPSNTEPVVRIICEAKTEGRIDELVSIAHNIFAN